MQKAYEAQALQQQAPPALSTSAIGQGDAMAVDAQPAHAQSAGMDVDAPATNQKVASESKKRQISNDDETMHAGESSKRARFGESNSVCLTIRPVSWRNRNNLRTTQTRP